MGIGKAIYSKLTSDDDVSALVGTRVHPEIVKGIASPFVVYTEEASDFTGRTYTLAPNPIGRNVDVYCVADTYADSKTLADAVYAALDNRSGTWGGVAVVGSFCQGSTDDVAPLPDTGTDALYYVTTLSFLMWERV